MSLTNKDDHKGNIFHKKIFEELVKERFDEIKELADEINQNDLKLILSEKRFMISIMIENFSKK